MARSKKPETEETTSGRPEVDLTMDDAVRDDAAESADDAKKDAVAAPKADDTVEDAVLVEDRGVDDSEEAYASGEAVPDEVRDTPRPEPTPQIIEKTIVQKAGFGAMALGGAVAAGLGLLGGYVLWGQNQPDMGALTNRIATLEAQAAEPAPEADLSGIEEAVAGVETRLTEEASGLAASLTEVETGIGGLATDLTTLTDRVSVLERAPTADGNLTTEAIAAWEETIAGLRADMVAQQERMDGMAAEVATAVDAARAEAAAVEANAVEAAQRAEARAAVGRIMAALETGASYEAAVADLAALSQVEIPAVLASSAAEGVPSVTALQDAFPAAARAALAAARSEGVGSEGTGGFVGFLQSTFDVRSTTPREGDDPDAILSRAEAALGAGRLGDAMAEVASLPEVARGAMSDWLSQAEARQAAVQAAEDLNQSLSDS